VPEDPSSQLSTLLHSGLCNDLISFNLLIFLLFHSCSSLTPYGFIHHRLKMAMDQESVQSLINKAIDDLDPDLRKINRIVNISHTYHTPFLMLSRSMKIQSYATRNSKPTTTSRASSASKA
jgi:hypothetical protein